MRRGIALFLALLLPLLALGCDKTGSDLGTYSTAPGNTADDKPVQEKTVGILFPNDTQTRWQEDAKKLSAGLEELGCAVQIAYSQNDPARQAEQMEEMVKGSVDCLIVAAVDSLALTGVLEQAKNAGIAVIAYDRLLMNTDAAACYVGFDDLRTGIAIAERIVKAKQLESAQAEDKSYTVEFFMGSPENNSAVLLHQGIMVTLKPYLDSGVLVCRTGRTAFEDVCTQDWLAERAKADCQKYLAEFYPEETPDILCAASDDLAGGCIAALEESGRENWPLIIGQDGAPEGVKQIVAGKQSVTMYKNYGALVFQCLTAAQQLLNGKTVENGEIVCHNGVKEIPALLTETILIDGDNYRQELIDSGIYTEQQLTPENSN